MKEFDKLITDILDSFSDEEKAELNQLMESIFGETDILEKAPNVTMAIEDNGDGTYKRVVSCEGSAFAISKAIVELAGIALSGITTYDEDDFKRVGRLITEKAIDARNNPDKED